MKFPDPPGKRLADFRLFPWNDFFARAVVFDHLSVIALRREIPADLLQVVIAGTMNLCAMDQYHRRMWSFRFGAQAYTSTGWPPEVYLALGPVGAGWSSANQSGATTSPRGARVVWPL